MSVSMRGGGKLQFVKDRDDRTNASETRRTRNRNATEIAHEPQPNRYRTANEPPTNRCPVPLSSYHSLSLSITISIGRRERECLKSARHEVILLFFFAFIVFNVKCTCHECVWYVCVLESACLCVLMRQLHRFLIVIGL